MGADLTARERLEPFRPGKDGPWDYSAAAHLARRLTFGSPRKLVREILEGGPRAAPAALLADRDETPEMKAVADSQRRIGSTEAIQTWWAHRMLRGNSPARDKLALFWHDHFATSDTKVRDARLMMDQVQLFIRRGPGSFHALLKAMAKDPAMLIWLDGNSNRRGEPNENFARELMELFSLGVGNYTEEDIKEAARAFTGWHVKNRKFWFNQRAHDTGSKTIFGMTGNLDGNDASTPVLKNAPALNSSPRSSSTTTWGRPFPGNCARLLASSISRAPTTSAPWSKSSSAPGSSTQSTQGGPSCPLRLISPLEHCEPLTQQP